MHGTYVFDKINLYFFNIKFILRFYAYTIYIVYNFNIYIYRLFNLLNTGCFNDAICFKIFNSYFLNN